MPLLSFSVKSVRGGGGGQGESSTWKATMTERRRPRLPAKLGRPHMQKRGVPSCVGVPSPSSRLSLSLPRAARNAHKCMDQLIKQPRIQLTRFHSSISNREQEFERSSNMSKSRNRLASAVNDSLVLGHPIHTKYYFYSPGSQNYKISMKGLP